MNVAVPPDVGAATVGKGIICTYYSNFLQLIMIQGPVGGQLSPAQLRKAKADTLKLCVAFAYSVKHRLRGEYGLDYDDYTGILPRSIVRYEEGSFNSSSSSPISRDASYNAQIGDCLEEECLPWVLAMSSLSG